MLAVNMPKEINRFCPKCNKHTIQKVSMYKAGKRRGWRPEIPKACKARKNNKEGCTDFHMPRM